MRAWVIRSAVALCVAGLAVFLFMPLDSAETGVSAKYLSLVGGGIGAPGVLGSATLPPPPNCSTWHELYPAFCANSHQDSYMDNGDACFSPCDEIVLDGVTYHITWVGPTYYMTCFDPAGPPVEVIWEPNQGPHNPGGPVCEEWQEIYPNFGQLCHIDDWVDGDGSGSVTPCDDVFSKGVRYHIDDIKLNIIIEPVSTGVEQNRWGQLKKKFFGPHDNMDN